MSFDQDCKERLRSNHLEQYHAIAVYGTGKGALIVLSCLKELKLQDKIFCVLDRDSCSIIGNCFKGFKVRTIDEAAGEIDAVLIAAQINGAVIKERLNNYQAKKSTCFKIIDAFERKRDSREYTLSDYKEYIDFIRTGYDSSSGDFVKITEAPYVRKAGDTKIIAWYLPQYHQIELNNKFHGQGFTEWTNVTQAVPQFTGHYQPHLPYDVGFYDLLNIEAMKRQIELANMYGIYGFCFHWYWFSGKRIMEKPLEMFLQHKELDIHFCLNWAAENWTSNWDGGTDEIILRQDLKEDDDIRFMEDILPYFKDGRYIKINGRPLLSIYRCDMFEKKRFRELVCHLRQIARRNGFPDLYILISTREDVGDVADWGADALVEFWPADIGRNCRSFNPRGYINPDFGGQICDISECINEKAYLRWYESDKVFRSALVSFDPSARKATRSDCGIIVNLTPQAFKTWLIDILNENKACKSLEEDFVFINSWNEWAEGSHLEPDMKYGYAYLQSVKEALEEIKPINERFVLEQINRRKTTLIEFYIHCIESMGDIIACEPIARFLKSQAQNSRITWIIKREFTELVRYNPDIDRILEVSDLNESSALCQTLKQDRNAILVDCHFDGRQAPGGGIHSNPVNPQVRENTYFFYGPLLKSFCRSAGLPGLMDAPVFHQKEHISLPELPKTYVVVHCLSSEERKDWQEEKWNELAQRLLQNNLPIVEIGFKKVIRANKMQAYYDHTAIRDLQILAEIIKGASFFLGVDSGFAHMANCFKIPAGILIGKYKNFSRQVPYTGFYFENREKYLIYPEKGDVKNISADDVIKRMQQINYKL